MRAQPCSLPILRAELQAHAERYEARRRKLNECMGGLDEARAYLRVLNHLENQTRSHPLVFDPCRGQSKRYPI